MKVTVLGCGSSGGVPLIGNQWGACDPQEPRNRRTRVSVLVQEQGSTLLVDTSPDMRQQLLAADVKTLDAVLFTHAHADHCHGIDELRSVNWLTRKPIDIFADPFTLGELESRFAYIFKKRDPLKYTPPSIIPHRIEGPFKAKGIDVIPFHQNHGPELSLGFRFGAFAYSTDVHQLDDKAFAALEGVAVWVVDCARETEHPSHSHLTQTLSWIDRLRPQQAYLTHMNESMDYATLCAKLPAHVRPAYDGLVIPC